MSRKTVSMSVTLDLDVEVHATQVETLQAIHLWKIVIYPPLAAVKRCQVECAQILNVEDADE